jgi:hypothetical protein
MMLSWLPGAPLSDLEGWYPDRVIKHFGTEELRKGFIVLQSRDLLNWYASYMRGKWRYRPGAIPSWEFITDEMLKPHYFKSGYQVIHIQYDEFVVSREYRERVCAELGGEYNEDKLNSVPGAGGGSTFDKFGFVGKGSQMQTRTRYKQVSKQVYEELFNNRPTLYNYYMQHCTDGEKRKFVKSLKLNL